MTGKKTVIKTRQQKASEIPPIDLEHTFLMKEILNQPKSKRLGCMLPPPHTHTINDCAICEFSSYEYGQYSCHKPEEDEK